VVSRLSSPEDKERGEGLGLGLDSRESRFPPFAKSTARGRNGGYSSSVTDKFKFSRLSNNFVPGMTSC
jgi:hypothetical protein